MKRALPRPAFLRALGSDEPPDLITVDAESFWRVDTFKHDSWAATALYESAGRKIVCKFNRHASLFGIPMRWLGRRLARREAVHYLRLANVPGIPRVCGQIYVNQCLLPHAVAHEFVEGHPLGKNEIVSEQFDEQLRELVARVHQHDMAYVDLHKRENIIVGEDGVPHLIDFQVSWMVRPDRPWWGFAGRWWLKRLQQMDCYHVAMHLAHHRRLRGNHYVEPHRPLWIKAHRIVTVPIRQTRRRLLVILGIRKAQGDASSEYFPEQAFR
jgi:hypothetical protein